MSDLGASGVTLTHDQYRELLKANMESGIRQDKLDHLGKELETLKAENTKLAAKKKGKRRGETAAQELNVLIAAITKPLSPSEKADKQSWYVEALQKAKKADALAKDKMDPHHWEAHVVKIFQGPKKRKAAATTASTKKKKKTTLDDVQHVYSDDVIDGENPFFDGGQEAGLPLDQTDQADDEDVGATPMKPNEFFYLGGPVRVQGSSNEPQSDFETYVSGVCKEGVETGTYNFSVLLQTGKGMYTDNAQFGADTTQTFQQQDATIARFSLPENTALPNAQFGKYVAWQISKVEIKLLDTATPSLVLQQGGAIAGVTSVKTGFFTRVELSNLDIDTERYDTLKENGAVKTSVKGARIDAGHWQDFYQATRNSTIGESDIVCFYRIEAIEDATLASTVDAAGTAYITQKVNGSVNKTPPKDTVEALEFAPDTAGFVEPANRFTIIMTETKSPTWKANDPTATPPVAQADYFGYVDVLGQTQVQLDLFFNYARVSASDYKLLTKNDVKGAAVPLDVFVEETSVTPTFRVTSSERDFHVTIPAAEDGMHKLCKPHNHPRSEPLVSVEIKEPNDEHLFMDSVAT